MSGPVPSPSMNGTTGVVGTSSLPAFMVIASPSGAARRVEAVVVEVADISCVLGELAVAEGYCAESDRTAHEQQYDSSTDRPGGGRDSRRVRGVRARIRGDHPARAGPLRTA